MNKIQTFNHEMFGALRTVIMPDGQIGFVGRDVAKALGYKDASKAILAHVEDEDKMLMMIPTDGRNGNLWRSSKTAVITESGVYSLILSSKLPQAKEFKRWVTSVVLVQIRKTGGYIPRDKDDDEKSILIKTCKIYEKTIELQNEQLLSQRPQVAFANALCADRTSIHMSEMAKLITQNGHEIGRTRLFTWMREHGYIFKNSTEPRQEWISRGYFEVQANIIEINGRIRENLTPLITAEGQKYFLQVFNAIAA